MTPKNNGLFGKKNKWVALVYHVSWQITKILGWFQKWFQASVATWGRYNLPRFTGWLWGDPTVASIREPPEFFSRMARTASCGWPMMAHGNFDDLPIKHIQRCWFSLIFGSYLSLLGDSPMKLIRMFCGNPSRDKTAGWTFLNVLKMSKWIPYVIFPNMTWRLKQRGPQGPVNWLVMSSCSTCISW